MINETPETIVSETKARQGRAGRQVLTVLGISMLLALFAGAVALMAVQPADDANAGLTVVPPAAQPAAPAG